MKETRYNKFFLKKDLTLEVRMIGKDLGKERTRSSNFNVMCKVKEKLVWGGRWWVQVWKCWEGWVPETPRWRVWWSWKRVTGTQGAFWAGDGGGRCQHGGIKGSCGQSWAHSGNWRRGLLRTSTFNIPGWNRGSILWKTDREKHSMKVNKEGNGRIYSESVDNSVRRSGGVGVWVCGGLESHRLMPAGLL